MEFREHSPAVRQLKWFLDDRGHEVPENILALALSVALATVDTRTLLFELAGNMERLEQRVDGICEHGDLWDGS